jgi:ankyrin repeat protein
VDPVGEFLDACIDRPDEARRLAAADPSLLQATQVGSPLLHWCVIEDFPSGATTLLDLGVPVDQHEDSGRTPLHHACALGRLGCARLLLRRGADANAINDHLGENPLHLAAQSASLDVVLLLLDLGARADYVLSTMETIFGAVQGWVPGSRAMLLGALAPRGITRESMFAKMGNCGYATPEQAFGW